MVDERLESDLVFLNKIRALLLAEDGLANFYELISIRNTRALEKYYSRTWGGAGLIVRKFIKKPVYKSPWRTRDVVRVQDDLALEITRLLYLFKYNLKCIFYQNKGAFYYGIGKTLEDAQMMSAKYGLEDQMLAQYKFSRIIEFAISFLEEFRE